MKRKVAYIYDSEIAEADDRNFLMNKLREAGFPVDEEGEFTESGTIYCSHLCDSFKLCFVWEKKNIFERIRDVFMREEGPPIEFSEKEGPNGMPEVKHDRCN